MCQLNTEATVELDKSRLITPGNRPLFRFANDPTVLCLHNPYQQKCQKGDIDWHQERKHYLKNSVYQCMMTKSDIGRLSCADFYNQTDGLPLWWQQLRQQALEEIREADNIIKMACTVDKDGPDSTVITAARNCDAGININNNRTIDFYIHWQEHTLKKYVTWHPCWRPQKRVKSYMQFIDICYIDDGRNKSQFANAHISLFNRVFTDCLWHYGKITEYRASSETNTENGT